MVTPGKPFILDGQPDLFTSPIMYVSAEEMSTLRTGEALMINGVDYKLGDIYFLVVADDDERLHTIDEPALSVK